MKQFITTFAICLLPILIVLEVIGLLLPESLPYGIIIISRLFVILFGSIVAIANLKKKHNLKSFGKSLLAGSIVVIVGFVISLVLYTLFHESSYRNSFEEVLVVFGGFALAHIGVLLMVLLVAGMWYVFEKAGQKGYSMFIPIYSLLVMLDIAKKPRWWFFMFLIPIANIVFGIMMLNGISKNFGKDEGFTAGLIFLNGIFWAILGYGDAKYLGAPVTTPEMDDILDA